MSILSGSEWDSSMSVEGHHPVDGEDMQAFMNALSPGYFKTMRIPLLEGRDFTDADVQNHATFFSSLLADEKSATVHSVAIVNRKFANHFFKGRSAIGRRIGFGTGPDARQNIEIVGVVEDSLYEGPREGVRRQVFIPNNGSSSAYNTLRNVVRQLDAALPIYEMKTVQAQLDETLLTDHLIATLSAGFGFLATLLASIGLYGVMAFVVARRRKELGIRLALGAQPGLVIWLMMREVLMLLAIGLAIGLPSALALGRFVESQLYGVKAQDPTMAVATLVVLSVVSATAGLIPARKASRIDPILALRYE